MPLTYTLVLPTVKNAVLIGISKQAARSRQRTAYRRRTEVRKEDGRGQRAEEMLSVVRGPLRKKHRAMVNRQGADSREQHKDRGQKTEDKLVN